MKKLVAITLIATLMLNTAIFGGTGDTEGQTTYQGAEELEINIIGRYDSKSGVGGTEILAYAPKAKKIFAVNGAEKALDIVGIETLKQGDLTNYTSTKRIHLDELKGVESAGDITSVAIAKDESFIVVAVPADPKQENGSLVFLDINGNYLNTVTVGALPDMVKITSDNKIVLVANEGEPNDEYTIDPEGSVSIVDVSAGVENATVETALFDSNVEIETTIRKANPNATYAESLEPEYIDVNADNTKAYVVCQESNAVAVLDITSKTFDKVYDLGTKDYSLAKNAIDASNKDDKINMTTYPVLSYYQPDGITLARIDGKTLLFTANEGDSQDYEGYSEEERVADVAESVALNAENYKGYTQEQIDTLVENGLFDQDQLGRLKITTANGKNAEGKYETLYGYGGRSFSIFDAESFKLIYDSENDFETITAKAIPEYFNSDSKNKFDDRSDDKGPEPENIVVGMVGGSYYAFIGLERVGGMMVYNVTNVNEPRFVSYITTRDFAGEEAAGDQGPEGMVFVPAKDSPTGNPVVMVGNEVSGTVAMFDIGIVESKKDTIKTKEYRIKNGDVLWKIAKQYDVTWEELCELNKFENPHLIYAGEKLLVPVK